MGYARVGNPNLKPEESTGHEVGARLGDKHSGRLRQPVRQPLQELHRQHHRRTKRTMASRPENSTFEVMENRDKCIYGAGTAQWQFAPSWQA